jgi:hypothetical protein
LRLGQDRQQLQPANLTRPIRWQLEQSMSFTRQQIEEAHRACYVCSTLVGNAYLDFKTVKHDPVFTATMLSKWLVEAAWGIEGAQEKLSLVSDAFTLARHGLGTVPSWPPEWPFYRSRTHANAHKAVVYQVVMVRLAIWRIASVPLTDEELDCLFQLREEKGNDSLLNAVAKNLAYRWEDVAVLAERYGPPPHLEAELEFEFVTAMANAEMPKPIVNRKCKNSERDEWVAKLKEEQELSLGAIHEELVRIAPIVDPKNWTTS